MKPLLRYAQDEVRPESWNLDRACSIKPIEMSETPSLKPIHSATHAEVSVTKPGSFARTRQFRYYIHDGISSCRLQLIGDLTEADMNDLNGCWRTVRTTLGARQLVLDLHALRSVDEAGKQWLASMAQEGASCSPESYLRDLVGGKHSPSAEATTPAAKPGLVAKVLHLFRNANIEAAK